MKGPLSLHLGFPDPWPAGDSDAEAPVGTMAMRLQDAHGNVVAESLAPYPDVDALQALLQRADVGRVLSLEVRLGPPFVQSRTLHDLPPVQPQDLVRLVFAHKERFFRSVPANALISARWEKTPAGERVARAALADGALLEDIETAARGVGTRVDRFVALLPDGDDPGRALELRTPVIARRRIHSGRRRFTAMAAIAVSGWSIAAATYLVDLNQDDEALRHELARMQTTLDAVDDLEARMAMFTPIAEALRGVGPAGAWASEMLRGVARSIPRGMHVHAVRLERRGEVRLEGHAEGMDVSALSDSLSSRWTGVVRLVEGESPNLPDFITLILDPSW